MYPAVEAGVEARTELVSALGDDQVSRVDGNDEPGNPDNVASIPVAELFCNRFS